MGDAARQLLEQALGLSEVEREQIAQQLLESLVDPAVEAAWTEEIRRRRQDPGARFVSAADAMTELQGRHAPGR